MRRGLIITVLLLIAQLTGLRAQTTFTAPDTVCIRQPITMKPIDTTASSYYWSFCSGYLMNKPDGLNIGLGYGLNGAADIEIAKNDDGMYYGFFINRAVPELIRLDFGNSLSNIPAFQSFGDLGGTIPTDANSVFLMRDALNRWVMFAVSGSSVGNSSLFRLDYGTSLSNTPNCVNMGNLGGILNGPKGFFAAQEGPYWYGFAVNSLDDKLIRFDFGTNISNTPLTVDLGNPSGTFSGPSDMAAIRDNIGNWHFFVTNFLSNRLAEVSIGASLAATPVGTVMAPNPDSLFNPTSIIMARECGVDYAFITNASRNSLVRIAFQDLATLTFRDISWDFVPGLKSATSLSHVIREKDNLYSFVVNTDNSLGLIGFAGCTPASSSLRSSTEKYPPSFMYYEPADYSVFLSLDEGLPTARMECHTITALPIPSITIVDDTLICQGDTAQLYGIAFGTDTLKWTPSYNNTNTQTTIDALFTYVYPEYSRPYHFIAIYPNGCILDSAIVVNVSKVQADAGVDRKVGDGSITVLGGPMTTEGTGFTYQWSPTNFLDNPTAANPISDPFYDMTYSLTVTNSMGCKASDTVVVRVDCDVDINLPNAFVPEDFASGNNYFGILNKNVVKLNHFRIYDRWGKEVFSTTDISEMWDGKFNGVECAYGVYVWTVDGFCNSGKRISKSGNVTLLR
jgi:gliding motility-associated-like protein